MKRRRFFVHFVGATNRRYRDMGYFEGDLSPSGFEPKATLYASHCTDDSPLFVAAWYTIATALVTAVGALAGAKLLRY
jgi:hypothetical protein